MKFQTAAVIQKDGNKAKDYCALGERCFQEKHKFKRHVKSPRYPVCSWFLFLKEIVLRRLKRATLRILLHVMTMLTKLMCALSHLFYKGSDYMTVQYRHARSTVTVQYRHARSTLTILYRHARSTMTVLYCHARSTMTVL